MTNRLNRILVACIGIVALAAWRGAITPVTLRPESRLWVDGTSTVRDFQCKATAMTAAFQADSAPLSAVLAGDRPITTGRFEVPVAKLDCSNGTMNGHMMKALKGQDQPLIAFTLVSYEITAGTSPVAAVLHGTLEIGGTQQSVTLPVVLADGGDGSVRLTGSHEISMRDFNLQPPSLMLGTLKVRDRVKVGFDLVLK
jgi:hypothetical protein